MKSRPFHPQFWKDDYILNLDPLEKLLFNFFISNENRSLTPYYEVSPILVKTYTGLKGDFIEKCKAKFQQDGKFIFWGNWVFVVNGSRYEQYTGEKLQPAVDRELACVPQAFKDFIANVMANLEKEYPIDRVSVPYGYPHNNNSNNNSNSNSNNKRDKVIKLDNKSNELDTEQDQLIVQANDLMAYFSKRRGKTAKSYAGWIKNFKYWITDGGYTVKDIKRAIDALDTGKFFANDADLTLLFRKSNKQGDCDYIGQLLNYMPEFKTRKEQLEWLESHTRGLTSSQMSELASLKGDEPAYE